MIDRAGICSKLSFSDNTQRSDLLNTQLTHDHLLGLLAVIVGSRHDVLVTAVRSDHGPDPVGSVHGHEEGFAIDVWVPASTASGFVSECIYNNHFVTKVGLGGSFKSLHSEGVFNGTLVFYDNSTEHIHLQTL